MLWTGMACSDLEFPGGGLEKRERRGVLIGCRGACVTRGRSGGGQTGLSLLVTTMRDFQIMRAEVTMSPKLMNWCASCGGRGQRPHSEERRRRGRVRCAQHMHAKWRRRQFRTASCCRGHHRETVGKRMALLQSSPVGGEGGMHTRCRTGSRGRGESEFCTPTGLSCRRSRRNRPGACASSAGSGWCL